jgi:hypothetical protein
MENFDELQKDLRGEQNPQRHGDVLTCPSSKGEKCFAVLYSIPWNDIGFATHKNEDVSDNWLTVIWTHINLFTNGTATTSIDIIERDFGLSRTSANLQ